MAAIAFRPQYFDESAVSGITNVPVNKKAFRGTSARTTVKDVHIKVDHCVGASTLSSYAILTSPTADDDIVAYFGVAKVF